MSAWTNATYTEKGLRLLAKLSQGSSLKITRAVSGTGYVLADLLSKQTAVSGAKQELRFKAASYPENGTCKLPMYLTNEGLGSGYTAKQIGLYANDPDEGEILYFIAQSNIGTAVPSAAEMPEYSATWTFYFRYGQADKVNVTVDPSHTVTEDMLEEVRVIAEQGVSVAKTGSVVVFDNAAALPIAGLKLFGKTVQSGVPTPDAPVELVSIENPEIVVAGKNLLPIGTATFEVTKLFMLDTPIPAGTYWLSCNIESADTDGTLSTIVFLNNTGANVLYLPLRRGDVSQKITLREPADRVQLCAAYNNNEGVGDEATWSNVQLEASDKFTGYEAYKGVQTVVVTTPDGLRGIPVTSGGNYTDKNGQQWVCDEVDFVRGVYVQRVNRLTISPTNPKTFVGSDSLIYYPTTNYGIYGTRVLCSRFADVGFNSSGASVKFAGFTTVAEFNAFVTDNAVDVAYILAEPIETPLSAEELSAYAALRANNPYTTISNSAGAGMEVDCISAQHEAGFRMATAKQPIEDPANPGCYYRMVDGEKEWLNPPLYELGTEFRTADRTNGKPVYAKQVRCDGVSSDSTGFYEYSEADVLPVRCEAFLVGNGETITLPYSMGITEAGVAVVGNAYACGKTIHWHLSEYEQLSGYALCATVYYSKKS